MDECEVPPTHEESLSDEPDDVQSEVAREEPFWDVEHDVTQRHNTTVRRR